MKVELICFLFNQKVEDLTGKPSEENLAKITIETQSIESVVERWCTEKDEIDKGRCMVYMKSGDNFLIGNSYESMVQIWNGTKLKTK